MTIFNIRTIQTEYYMMEKITEIPNENPIFSVILVLGFLSTMMAFYVAGNEIPLTFMDTTVLGIICGICSLPLGFKLVNLRQRWGSEMISTS